VRAKKKVA